MPSRVLLQRDDGRKEAGATTTHLPEGDNLYFTEERAQDAAASMLVDGTHTGISFAYDDAAGRLNVTVSGGSGGSIYMPLTNGAVPPELVHNQDGSLIYTRVA